MAEMKTEWAYPLLETTLDKRLSRPGVQKGLSAELTGVDGLDEGGLRPFPGFKRLYTMDALSSQTNHGLNSEVLDFKPVDFRIGAEYYGYGFVYRAARDSFPDTSDVFLDYWNSGTETWTKCKLLMSGVDSSAQFDVVVAGRFVYCFAAGRSPSLFYVEATNEKIYDAEADTHLDSTNAGTSFIANPNMVVAGVSGTYPQRALIRFNTDAEQLQTVESARLEFTVTENFNTGAISTFEMFLVNDPSNSNVEWSPVFTSWNTRSGATAWSTPGGTFAGTPTVSRVVEPGFRGRVSTPVTAMVQACLNSAGRPQDFMFKTDFFIRVISGGQAVYLGALEQANPKIQPRLYVTYSSKAFFTDVVVGVDGVNNLPGPGLQPTLKSPEAAIVPGTFTTLEGDNRPGAAQIVLTETVPYSAPLFPNPETGLCETDVLPSPPVSSSSSTSCSPITTEPGCSPEQLAALAGLRITLSSPSYKQTNVSVTPELSWIVFHNQGTPLPTGLSGIVWDLYFTKDGEGDITDCETRVATGITELKFSVGTLFASGHLEYNTKYLWRVLGRSLDCDYSFSSPTIWFTTGDKFKARKLEPGDYAFGYMLVDSRTGRKSAFSEVAQARAEDFRISTNLASVQREKYVGIELVYDSHKYDLMYVYRSVKIQDAGGTMVAGIPFLDAIITLEDYHTCENGEGRTFDPNDTDQRHALYFYELEDKQLVYQTPYIDRAIFDQRMPFGGTALFYDNTMLVSRIKSQPDSSEEVTRVEDINKGLGEMRWSSLQEFSPELFPPFNRYNPTNPSNEVVTFVRVGSNALGLSKDRVFHIRKSGGFIRVQEMHEGYGVVNPKAAEVVGSVAYYLSSHGLKAVDTQAQLDEVRNLNSVFSKEWTTELSYVQLGYDPTMNALFLLNPIQEESYVYWFTNAKTTKLVDMTFDHVAQGAWPENFASSNYADTLTRRALFLQNRPHLDSPWTGPRVYYVDHARVRQISGGTSSWNGQKRLTMLDFAGDSRLTATSAWDNGAGNFSISATGATPTIAVSGAYAGSYLYCIYSVTHPQHIGKKAFVTNNSSSKVYLVPSDPWIDDIHAGMVFSVSPVYFEWVGHNLGLNNEVNQVFSLADFFRIKVANTLGCAFTDVEGPPTEDAQTANTPLNRFVGTLYSGTESEALTTAQTKTSSGGFYGSITDGEGLVYAAFGSDSSDGRYGAKGNSLSPGVRIFCADLDFRLLACSVRGNILTMERATNTRGS